MSNTFFIIYKVLQFNYTHVIINQEITMSDLVRNLNAPEETENPNQAEYDEVNEFLEDMHDVLFDKDKTFRDISYELEQYLARSKKAERDPWEYRS